MALDKITGHPVDAYGGNFLRKGQGIVSTPSGDRVGMGITSTKSVETIEGHEILIMNGKPVPIDGTDVVSSQYLPSTVINNLYTLSFWDNRVQPKLANLNLGLPVNLLRPIATTSYDRFTGDFHVNMVDDLIDKHCFGFGDLEQIIKRTVNKDRQSKKNQYGVVYPWLSFHDMSVPGMMDDPRIPLADKLMVLKTAAKVNLSLFESGVEWVDQGTSKKDSYLVSRNDAGILSLTLVDVDLTRIKGIAGIHDEYLATSAMPLLNSVIEGNRALTPPKFRVNSFWQQFFYDQTNNPLRDTINNFPIDRKDPSTTLLSGLELLEELH